MLEKEWNPNIPVDTLKRDLGEIHPTASSLKLICDKVRNNENQSMTDAFEYSQQNWYESHKTPELKVGEFMLVLTLGFNNINGPKKLKDSCSGPFIIKYMHGTN
ncbi:hypothetical protein O181_077919 [Austropuccinia psidii MF-1]|uniref:Uncharacterized protein n=1 Tax=Austropuccinia psidii MF-1 TaxID=1389203 RepID=A0A9Q3FFW5_9BASI|nr:hypothetical protein [Austropuccinia psidii MF-1]